MDLQVGNRELSPRNVVSGLLEDSGEAISGVCKKCGKIRRGMGSAKEDKENMVVVWLQEVGCDLKIATLPAKKESLHVSPELPPELGPTRPSCRGRGACSASRSGAFARQLEGSF